MSLWQSVASKYFPGKLPRKDWRVSPMQIIHHRSSFHLELIAKSVLKAATCVLFTIMVVMHVSMLITSWPKQEISLPVTTNGNVDCSSQQTQNSHREGGNKKFWTRISDEVYVYSAHLDVRNFSTPFRVGSSKQNYSFSDNAHRDETATHSPPSDNKGGADSDKWNFPVLVRIVGMKKVPPLREFIKRDVLDWFRIKHEMNYSHSYQCKLFFPNRVGGLDHIEASNVTYTVIEEGVKIYAGSYFSCYFDRQKVFKAMGENTLNFQKLSPLQVAIYPVNVPDYPMKLIDVNTIMTMMSGSDSDRNHVNFQRGTLAVCVRPLFGPFDELQKLVQFISYYHVVGVTQFNFYLMSTSSQVRKFLRASTKSGSVRIHVYEWNLPTGNTSELWDYGSLAALNDCLFSNVDQEFVIFVDVDEFIVPHGYVLSHKPTPDLWSIINLYDKSKTFQYLIRNTFFCNEFCKKNCTTSGSTRRSAVFSSDLRLPIFECTVRTKRVWNVALRSKFIVNPRQVLAVGHHLATKYVQRNTDFRFTGYSIPVDPSVAIMHHYRECESISTKSHPVLTRIQENDTMMLRFKHDVDSFVQILTKFIHNNL